MTKLTTTTKRGRPPLPAGTARTVSLRVRVTPAQWETYSRLDNGATAVRDFLDAQAAQLAAEKLTEHERFFVSKQLKLQLLAD